MTLTLTPADLALSWPVLAEHLALERWKAAKRMLGIVADLQAQHEGDPVPLGLGRLTEAGLTPGEAGHARARVLPELVERGCLDHIPTRARNRPDLWSLRAPLRFWGLHFALGVAEAERSCRAQLSSVARFPGQSVAGMAEMAESGGPAARRPGLLPRETRDRRQRRATDANRPGLSRANSRPLSSSYELRNVDVETLKIVEEIKRLDQRGLGLTPAGLTRLVGLTRGELAPAAAAFVVAGLAAFGTRVPDRQVANVGDLLAEAKAKAARSRAYTTEPPAGSLQGAHPERPAPACVVCAGPLAGGHINRPEGPVCLGCQWAS